MVLKIALAVSLVLVSGSLTARHAVGAGTPHRTYSNVALHTVGMWTRTEIDIPRGAMVAIMAEGECFNSKNPMKKRLDPSACLRFKIGEKGMKTNLARVYVSQHVSVTKSSGGVPSASLLPPS